MSYDLGVIHHLANIKYGFRAIRGYRKSPSMARNFAILTLLGGAYQNIH